MVRAVPGDDPAAARPAAAAGSTLFERMANLSRGGAKPGAAEDESAVLRAVSALEFVHASALVHDDVMDGAVTRHEVNAFKQVFLSAWGVDES